MSTCGLCATRSAWVRTRSVPPSDPPAALLEAALAAGASAVSVALGDPAEVIELTRAAGVPLIASARRRSPRLCRRSSRELTRSSPRAPRAGGHRTTFDVDAGPLPLVGTMVLVPRVVDAVEVPVLAGGGIMDGRGVAAALALGAQGAWIGTRFMQAAEAGTAPIHQEALSRLADTDTFVTDSVTGRPARWIRNRAVDTFESAPGHLGWPGQAPSLARSARQRPRRATRTCCRCSRPGAGMIAEVQPAEEIVEELARDTREVLARLG